MSAARVLASSIRVGFAGLTLAACGGSSSAVPDGAVAIDAAVAIDVANPVDASASSARLADLVVDAPGASGSGFGDPANAVNGVRGGGTSGGSFDVYSLAYPPAANTAIVLGWSGASIANGAGDDLAVFENPFDTGGGRFMDLIVVEVSRDGATWRPIAHDYVTADETIYDRTPTAWVGFAGVTPVLFNADSNVVDPFDRAAAGGDGLDLDDVVGDDAAAVALRTDGARYVRLIAAPAEINPDTGATFVHDGVANGADIDGLYGRYVVDDP